MLTALCLVAFAFQEPAAKDWKKTHRLHDVEVSVPWAAWTQVRYKDDDGRTATTEGYYLCVVVAIKSKRGKSIAYQSWNAPGETSGLPAMCFGAAELLKRQDVHAVGRIDSGTIRPDRPLYDVFVFAQNERKTKSLELILDTRRLGEDDALKLNIPIDQIPRAKPNQPLDAVYFMESVAKPKRKAS
jgi:hypothetical protein